MVFTAPWGHGERGVAKNGAPPNSAGSETFLASARSGNEPWHQFEGSSQRMVANATTDGLGVNRLCARPHGFPGKTASRAWGRAQHRASTSPCARGSARIWAPSVAPYVRSLTIWCGPIYWPVWQRCCAIGHRRRQSDRSLSLSQSLPRRKCAWMAPYWHLSTWGRRCHDRSSPSARWTGVGARSAQRSPPRSLRADTLVLTPARSAQHGAEPVALQIQAVAIESAAKGCREGSLPFQLS